MKKIYTPSFTGMLPEELQELCTSIEEPAYRAGQILSWIYRKGAGSFAQMHNLPEQLREELQDKYLLYSTAVDSITESADGTEKFAIRLSDGNIIESVLLRNRRNVAACVSTQVGCAMACSFCASGKLGFERNLDAGEIVEQALHIRNRLSKTESLTSIVFMGIGEPLANFDNVIRAIKIMNADWGLGISMRRITVSTVGMVAGIRRLAGEGLEINLAISLHAPDDFTRSGIIPSNKKNSIRKILTAAREYFEVTHRNISFEYTLIEGVNSSVKDAEDLASLLRGIQCNINIIPLNPIEESQLRPPDHKSAQAFCRTLEKKGMVVTLRRKKGDDADAACGQLRLQTHKCSQKTQQRKKKPGKS